MIAIGLAPVSAPPTSGPRCTSRNPRTLIACTRAEGHSGRHHFAWQHLDNRVRQVWADCQVCQCATADGAVCRECGAA
jgi:hypothetical protein